MYNIELVDEIINVEASLNPEGPLGIVAADKETIVSSAFSGSEPLGLKGRRPDDDLDPGARRNNQALPDSTKSSNQKERKRSEPSLSSTLSRPMLSLKSGPSNVEYVGLGVNACVYLCWGMVSINCGLWGVKDCISDLKDSSSK